jgi:hypothetical protein
MEQIALAIFGVTAIWLSQDKDEKRRKYAPVLGLCGQPFWFYTAYINQQWGIFVLCIFYTFSWYKGVKTYWLR